MGRNSSNESAVFLEAVFFRDSIVEGPQSLPMHVSYGLDARSASHDGAPAITHSMKQM
jgi:hypothetical protein